MNEVVYVVLVSAEIIVNRAVCTELATAVLYADELRGQYPQGFSVRIEEWPVNTLQDFGHAFYNASGLNDGRLRPEIVAASA